jgi:predicted RNase H-like HicB family nuclease
MPQGVSQGALAAAEEAVVDGHISRVSRVQVRPLLVDSMRDAVKAEFTAIIEAAPEGGYWAMCPEIPGANGQRETVDEAKESLKAAIELLLEDRREDMLRGLPADAIQATVSVG